jgi:hypothetical protein
MSPEECGNRRSMDSEPLCQMFDRLVLLEVSCCQFQNLTFAEAVLALTTMSPAVRWPACAPDVALIKLLRPCHPTTRPAGREMPPRRSAERHRAAVTTHYPFEPCVLFARRALTETQARAGRYLSWPRELFD